MGFQFLEYVNLCGHGAFQREWQGPSIPELTGYARIAEQLVHLQPDLHLQPWELDHYSVLPVHEREEECDHRNRCGRTHEWRCAPRELQFQAWNLAGGPAR